MSRYRLFSVLTVAAFFVGLLATPASAVTPIDARYASDANLRDICGTSISSESSILDGSLKHYQDCTIYYSPATGVHEAYGAIRDGYRNAGGVQTLGFPIQDQRDVWVRFEFNVIGQAQDFENGTVTTSDNGTHALSTPVATEWNYQLNDLLMPITDAHSVPEGSRVRFTDGTIYSSSSATTTLYERLHGYEMKIPKKWGSRGGAWSTLGLPVSNMEDIPGGYQQQFEHGLILWEGDYELETAKPEAYIVSGNILQRYLAEGGPSVVGFPYSDQSSTGTGQIAHFENADITSNATDGSTQITWH